MKIKTLLTIVALVATLIPGKAAQADDELRGPTEAQKKLCRQEIDNVREKCNCELGESDEQVVDACSKQKEPKCEPCVVLLQCLESVSDNLDPRAYGAWEQVIPEAGSSAIHGSLGMATIHAMLLPTGKVLLASGSGWRNPMDTKTYPDEPYPEAAEGLFFRHGTKWERKSKGPFLDENREMYQRLVNNTAVYDPAKNTFFRVPPPPLIDNKEKSCEKYKGCNECKGCEEFHASDLFCSGHLHLPDGNPLFMGGTQYYAPIISGVRTSYIFDWRKEHETNWIDVDWRNTEQEDSPWTFSGLMERGRWYPTPVPLQDGRLVILSGLRGYDEKKGEGDPYLFEVNPLVEIFDPAKFNAMNPQEAWTSIDAQPLENSPFTQKLQKRAKYGTCLDSTDLHKQNVDSPPCHPEGDAEKRSTHDFKYDTFKLYPNVYNFGRGESGGERLFFTREGDFISMRSPDMATMRNVRQTYWMEVGGDRKNPQIRFELGKLRKDHAASYGASFVDPNDGSIRVIAGGKNSPGTLFLMDTEWTKRNRFLGARGSRDMETYRPGNEPRHGQWSKRKNFLGRHPQDDRILSNAILLPTKDVLFINGGNYQLQKPVFHPLLLKAKHDHEDNFQGYRVERMAEATQARQYHAVALLLPDGRVWTSGGNSAPARVTLDEAAWKAWESKKMPRGAQPEHDPDLVDLDVHFFREGRYARNQKGSLEMPAENWTAEIYSPPYLFIDGDRRAEIKSISNGPQQVEFDVPGADRDAKVYLLKSNQTYTTMIDGAPTIDGKEDRSGHYRLIKLPSVTHATDFGQRLYELESLDKGTGTGFRTPQAAKANIPPGYYMLFFIDAKGKPSKAKMVRFDDNATTP